MEQNSARVSRRGLLKVAGAGLCATAAARVPGDGIPGTPAQPEPTTTYLTPAKKLKGTLSILQRRHYVPRYDRWFDAYAHEWGRRVGVDVRIKHVDPESLVSRAREAIEAGTGHDLIEWTSSPAQLEPYLVDLRDLHDEAVGRFGIEQPLCKKAAYNPTTRKYYGYTHAWAPCPGDYRKSMWQQVGMDDGPATWEELREGGKAIKQKLNVAVGIGMSNELDSNIATRALMWSFGASVQNELEQVVINSPETIAAVTYMVRLYRETMTPEVFSWNQLSNNQGLIAGRLSYIANPVSALRTAQVEAPEVANDIFFTPPLRGPAGVGLSGPQPVFVYFVPKFSKNVDAAKEFLLNLSANDAVSTYQSELYNFPAFPSMVPQLDGWLADDPFGARPPGKLKLLQNAGAWSVDIGYPGPSNPAIGQVFTRSILPRMMARAAQGRQTPAESVAQAEAEIKPIFEKWRRRGLLNGETTPRKYRSGHGGQVPPATSRRG